MTVKAEEWRKVRESLGYSVREAAKTIRVSPRTWQKWEKGENKAHWAFYQAFLYINGVRKNV